MIQRRDQSITTLPNQSEPRAGHLGKEELSDEPLYLRHKHTHVPKHSQSLEVTPATVLGALAKLIKRGPAVNRRDPAQLNKGNYQAEQCI